MDTLIHTNNIYYTTFFRFCKEFFENFFDFFVNFSIGDIFSQYFSENHIENEPHISEMMLLSRYFFGVVPVTFLNAQINELCDEKPKAEEISM